MLIAYYCTGSLMSVKASVVKKVQFTEISTLVFSVVTSRDSEDLTNLAGLDNNATVFTECHEMDVTCHAAIRRAINGTR
jgi:hypothetical protein